MGHSTWSYFLDRKLDLLLNSFKTKADAFCKCATNVVVVKLFIEFYTARELNDHQTFNWMNSIQFKATMGDKSVETLCHFRVLKANFFSNLYNTTPSPVLNVEFPVSRICLFLVQHWKGGRGLALNINRIWNKISDMLQLALDSVNCLNFFCRPLSEVYLCELWRFPLYIQALASLFSQKRLNAWFRLICY